jgi:serine-type D-Ala-D-Ala carboxypeptidase (penicillin-binding protein 5/6)
MVATVAPRGSAARQAARRRRRLRRLLRTILVGTVLVVGVIVLALTGGGGGTTPGAATADTLPLANLAVSMPKLATVPAGTAVDLPWAPTGQSAVAIPSVGYAAQSGAESAVPIASLTKMMTAYVILQDHPLTLGEQGPQVTITTADAQDFGLDTETDQANIELQAGEVLTEYQLLEGLLVHSANDFAFSLADWDAGSVTAFVAKMNTTAATLGMTDSHFADASGYDPTSQSTAADLLKVASLDIENPVFASIVDMSTATLPLAGTVGSYTPLLTIPGVVGVKSGFTSAAGGGDVLAWRAMVGSQPVIVLAAVISQEGPTVLPRAGHLALAIAQAAAGQLTSVPVVTAGQVVGHATYQGERIALTAASSASLMAVGGDTVRGHVALDHHLRAGTRAGTYVGSATFSIGTESVSVPVLTHTKIPAT